jgi:hypothetical protein
LVESPFVAHLDAVVAKGGDGREGGVEVLVGGASKPTVCGVDNTPLREEEEEEEEV